MVLFWKNVDILGKTAVFPGGYGRIGDIPHGRISHYYITFYHYILLISFRPIRLTNCACFLFCILIFIHMTKYSLLYYFFGKTSSIVNFCTSSGRTGGYPE